MEIQALPGAATSTAARLLIHAAGDLSAKRRLFATFLRRLLTLYLDGPLHDERAPLSLQINDAHGSQVFALDDAGPLVDVALPAGTYHVTAHLGDVRRGYTMTLRQGESFDLYLRLAPDGQCGRT